MKLLFGLLYSFICTTSKSDTSLALAFCHFREQLSMCLWRYNSQMLLYHLSLPYVEQAIVGTGWLTPSQQFLPF